MHAPLTILLLMLLLQIKHMFADFFLQTRTMLSGRDIYLHVGRAQHVAVHALGTVMVFAAMGASLRAMVIIVVGEAIAHYHIDYWKGRHTAANGLTPEHGGYWRATGLDQALHQLTYIAMIWAWLTF
ncbi:Protein of unknown function [Salinihabitans flavidus]|uniref:DUF3307 domain-containing protein n=1 Tax=Salinihabitans flavidus TaxID=569882 RepID=A0A1H8QRB0_9RHOB|nr:DUF3307 domain-containing protein [Salinihabitans flavidus]SEO56586.1 Protein of unknown function [Salinihabitans flavidus]